jgi:hypothetical protein
LQTVSGKTEVKAMKSNRSSAQKIHLILLAVTLLIFFLLFIIPGCNSSSSDAQTGTLAVSLTDAPACGFDAVNVTISKVRIHQSSNAAENAPGWEEIILNPMRKIDLLSLTNGALEELGEIPLAAGHYTQLRLVLADNNGSTLSNSVIPTGTTDEIALDTPSAMQSGLKLINEFEVLAGERVDLLLDFNACRSVVSRGNGSYGLKPVIRVLPITLSGIGGFVSPAGNVTVSAQINGEIVRSTVPNPLTGEFFVSHLDPDTYDMVITADGHATTVITGVPIANATSTAMISSANNPVTLATSATQSISGTVLLNPPSTSEIAEATAKQTLPGATLITVKSQAVDLLSNAYSLALPTAAPWLGSYGDGTLPITLTEQSPAAGEYSIVATASGYQTQSFTKNIAAADATQDFTLVP